MFSADNVNLLTDNKSDLINQIESNYGIEVDCSNTVDELKDILEEQDEYRKHNIISQMRNRLKSYDDFSNVIDIYDDIIKREVANGPLYFEWNTWRAMEMINYASKVLGNFTTNNDGMPRSNAPGNFPDIEVEYDSFKLIIEVTLQSGSKQYESENEPVARHYGKVNKTTEKPLYCLFIAPKINESAIAHFFIQNQVSVSYYGGKTKIIPLSLDQFITLLHRARDYRFNDSKQLEKLLETAILVIQEVEDESMWSRRIDDLVSHWLEAS